MFKIAHCQAGVRHTETHHHIELELLTKPVFFGWYRSVFLGIYHTDTEGKLGQYFWYRRYKKVCIYSKMTSARRTTALAAPKEVLAFLAESGTYVPPTL